ncbi:hypothetical protein BC829DRAFT_447097 [Chytridium lagenaria]|nr:hypothetical protein BC829DRAFT_447097 [Chytridium lagenaria]
MKRKAIHSPEPPPPGTSSPYNSSSSLPPPSAASPSSFSFLSIVKSQIASTTTAATTPLFSSSSSSSASNLTEAASPSRIILESSKGNHTAVIPYPKTDFLPLIDESISSRHRQHTKRKREDVPSPPPAKRAHISKQDLEDSQFGHRYVDNSSTTRRPFISTLDNVLGSEDILRLFVLYALKRHPHPSSHRSNTNSSRHQSIQEQSARPRPSLHDEILCLERYLSPPTLNSAFVHNLITRYRKAILTKLPFARLHVFGSTSTGLSLPWSDMDLVIVDYCPHPSFPNGHAKESSQLNQGRQCSKLSKVASKLYTLKLARDINVIKHAAVPIVKCKDVETGIALDISYTTYKSMYDSKLSQTLLASPALLSMPLTTTTTTFTKSNFSGSATGPAAVMLIQSLRTLLPPLRPLVLLLKQFLLVRNLNEVFAGGVGGYGCVLWMTAFLKLRRQKFWPESWLSRRDEHGDEPSHRRRDNGPAKDFGFVIDKVGDKSLLLESTEPPSTSTSADDPYGERDVGTLFLDFCRIFGVYFDYRQHGLSPGGVFLHQDSWTMAPAHVFPKTGQFSGKDGKLDLLCIVDPLNEGSDVFRGSVKIANVSSALRDVVEGVEGKKKQEEVFSSLRRVVWVTEVQERMRREIGRLAEKFEGGEGVDDERWWFDGGVEETKGESKWDAALTEDMLIVPGIMLHDGMESEPEEVKPKRRRIARRNVDEEMDEERQWEIESGFKRRRDVGNFNDGGPKPKRVRTGFNGRDKEYRKSVSHSAGIAKKKEKKRGDGGMGEIQKQPKQRRVKAVTERGEKKAKAKRERREREMREGGGGGLGGGAANAKGVDLW